MASSRSSGRAEPGLAPADAALLETVRAALAAFPADARFVVAFSGGLDSTVLLHLAAHAAGPARLLALHVHHGLQPAADAWPAHCERVAASLGVRFACARVGSRPAPGDSVEAWARRERYGALRRAAEGFGAAAVLTAHNADDRVETLLMRIGRGSAPDALDSLAPEGAVEDCRVARPLLALRRAALADCARARGLEWIEDPSNGDPRFARNALRASALPALEAALPGFAENALQAADLLAEAGTELRELARRDLAAAASPGDPWQLDRAALAGLSPFRQAGALKAWLESLGLPPAGRGRLGEMIAQLVRGAGAAGEVVHEGWLLSRHRDRIAARPAGSLPEAPQPVVFRWAGEAAVEFPGWGGRLRFVADDSPCALPGAWLASQPLALKPGSSSARLRPGPGRPSRTMKNLYQERAIPGWARRALPHVFAGERLLYAAGIGMGFVGEAADSGPATGAGAGAETEVARGVADAAPRRGTGWALRWECAGERDPRRRYEEARA